MVVINTKKTSEVLSLLRPIVHDTSKTAKITWFILVLHVGPWMSYKTSITSTAQWNTRINQVIFAVLDVS